jgi:regulator of sirC expression with transglutaminase-like and TPR domain
MPEQSNPETILRRIGAGPDTGFDIADGALALAALENPETDLDRLESYRHHLDELAYDLAESTGDRPDLSARSDALSTTLHDRHGYDSDTETYDDLANANLMRVIDRRKGLPVALGILYIHVARRQGWPIVGLSFPGHFLLRLEAGGERLIVDPFHRGRACGAGELRSLLKTIRGENAELKQDHYRQVSDREILLRLQNNVKLRLMQLNQVAKAAETVERMLLFAPEALALWREAGLMHAHVGNLGNAVSALETFLEYETRDGPRNEVAAHLQRLRRKLHQPRPLGSGPAVRTPL